MLTVICLCAVLIIDGYLFVVDIFGISDHDLMFTQEKCDFEDEGEAEVDPGTDYIQHRV